MIGRLQMPAGSGKISRENPPRATIHFTFGPSGTGGSSCWGRTRYLFCRHPQAWLWALGANLAKTRGPHQREKERESESPGTHHTGWVLTSSIPAILCWTLGRQPIQRIVPVTARPWSKLIWTIELTSRARALSSRSSGLWLPSRFRYSWSPESWSVSNREKRCLCVYFWGIL